MSPTAFPLRPPPPPQSMIWDPADVLSFVVFVRNTARLFARLSHWRPAALDALRLDTMDRAAVLSFVRNTGILVCLPGRPAAFGRTRGWRRFSWRPASLVVACTVLFPPLVSFAKLRSANTNVFLGESGAAEDAHDIVVDIRKTV